MEKHIRLVFEKYNETGYGFTLWAISRNFQTWYEIESWAPNDTRTVKREFYDTEKAFDFVERFEKRHGL